MAHIVKVPSDKLRIFSYKGIEYDDADIIYLQNNQYIYVSLDGNKI